MLVAEANALLETGASFFSTGFCDFCGSAAGLFNVFSAPEGLVSTFVTAAAFTWVDLASETVMRLLSKAEEVHESECQTKFKEHTFNLLLGWWSSQAD